MAATVCAKWGLNEGQLYPQQLPQTTQVGYVEAAPPLSPEFVLDYLLFDGDQGQGGDVFYPQSQLNPIPQAPAPPPIHWSSAQNPNSAKAEEKPTAQSKAARQRRKRISERTQELGQLIPGAGRMNTAEMLQTGFKYVKFLQAQIAMLDLAESSCFGEDVMAAHLMQALLAEPSLQEKLAGEELCLVPTKLVQELSKDRVLVSRPSMARDLHRLLH